MPKLKKGCPEHKPGKHTYKPPAPKDKMWQRCMHLFRQHPYRYYVTTGQPRQFCDLIHRKGLNCADQASLQNGHAQWFVSHDHKRITRFRYQGRDVGHAIFSIKCWNPKGRTWEWILMDRPGIPKNQGGYGKKYPKMPMPLAQYLAMFKGKVTVSGHWRITNVITQPQDFRPIPLP